MVDIERLKENYDLPCLVEQDLGPAPCLADALTCGNDLPQCIALLDKPVNEQAIRALDVDAQIRQGFEQGVEFAEARHIVSDVELRENAAIWRHETQVVFVDGPVDA